MTLWDGGIRSFQVPLGRPEREGTAVLFLALFALARPSATGTRVYCTRVLYPSPLFVSPSPDSRRIVIIYHYYMITVHLSLSLFLPPPRLWPLAVLFAPRLCSPFIPFPLTVTLIYASSALLAFSSCAWSWRERPWSMIGHSHRSPESGMQGPSNPVSCGKEACLGRKRPQI